MVKPLDESHDIKYSVDSASISEARLFFDSRRYREEVSLFRITLFLFDCDVTTKFTRASSICKLCSQKIGPQTKAVRNHFVIKYAIDAGTLTTVSTIAMVFHRILRNFPFLGHRYMAPANVLPSSALRKISKCFPT